MSFFEFHRALFSRAIVIFEKNLFNFLIFLIVRFLTISVVFESRTKSMILTISMKLLSLNLNKKCNFFSVAGRLVVPGLDAPGRQPRGMETPAWLRAPG
jgi:hypothetical protein